MINKELIKKLRAETNAPITLCAKALKEFDNDLDKAKAYLREQGIMKAQKYCTRTTQQGVCLSYVSDDAKNAAIIKVYCETDFVAKNESFVRAAKKLCEVLANHQNSDYTDVKFKDLDNQTVQDYILELSTKMGENVKLADVFVSDNTTNICYVAYNHHNKQASTLLAFSSDPSDKNLEIFRDLAMQINAMKPTALTEAKVDQAFLENEKKLIHQNVLKENTNKPSFVLDKIVEGRINKILKEICLESQPFLKKNNLNVKQYLSENNLDIEDLVDFFNFEI